LNSPVVTAAYTISSPTNPVPAISGTSPAFATAGGTAFTLTVNGSGFIPTSVVYWGASALTTNFVSANQLTAQVPAADIVNAEITAITVQTPTPGGGTSNSFQFEVDSASSGSTALQITTVSASVTAGSSANFGVTLPPTVNSATVSCLNLPAGASCSYTTGTVTIATSPTTPTGTYQVTVVFNETVSGTSTSWILLPILLLPLVVLRRKLALRDSWLNACLGLVLVAAAAFDIGCGGSVTNSTTTSVTHQATSSGVVTLTVH